MALPVAPGGDPGALNKVPTHGPQRQLLAEDARVKFQAWWEKATRALAQEKREAEAVT